MQVTIEKVSKEKANNIISSLSPEGLFYAIDNGVYVAIDNTNSEAYVEEFPTLEECERWLRNKDVEETLNYQDEKDRPKRLIDYIGERHGVIYADVFDYLKDLQYNPPEKNVEELVNMLLYIEANER